MMNTTLLDRINAVINVPEFEATLEANGSDLMELQMEWAQYDSFDALPGRFQRAILAGEAVIPYVPPHVPRDEPAPFVPKDWKVVPL